MLARLEYRLYDEQRGYPVLYYYQKIAQSEVSLRFACDYFVKDLTVYEKTSCAIDRGTYVVYVREAVDEHALLTPRPPAPAAAPAAKRVVVEVRHYRDDQAEHPLVQTYTFTNEADVLLHLQSNFHTINGEEWERTSAEIDEDRAVFVIYAQPSSERTAY